MNSFIHSKCIRRGFYFLSASVVLAAVSFGAQSAHASYVIAEMAGATAPPAGQGPVGTHVVVAGQGLEDGTNWIDAAQTQAMVFRDRSSSASVVLISAVPKARKDSYMQRLQLWNYKRIRYVDQDFTGQQLVTALTQVPLIASLDFIGHNGAFLGAALEDEGGNHRFYKVDVDHMVGKVKFSKDSYVRLLGCNTGWYLAPYIALKLGVPAAGTLTSGDVEIIYASGDWYYDDAGMSPNGDHSSKQNPISYSKPTECDARGGCVRMKAVNTSYVGQHGTYSGALPFAKFFCGSDAIDDCHRRMALSESFVPGVNSMTAPPGQRVSLTQFAQTVADQFCPATQNQAKRLACREAVEAHMTGEKLLDPTFTTLSTSVPQLSCTFTDCKFQAVNDSKGQRILVSTTRGKTTTFVDELNAYKAGFELLK